MKSAVVDRQSATIKIFRDGQVTRELPYRVISDDTVIVGDRLFSGPLPDLRKWGEEERGGRRRAAESDGWDFRSTDRPTFFMPSPAPPIRWAPLGPVEQYEKERNELLDRIGFADDGRQNDLLSLDRREKERKKSAARQSRRRRLPKDERNSSWKFKKGGDNKPEDGKSKGGKKKGKGKKKNKGGDGGKGGKKKSKGNKGGKGKGQRRRGGR